MHEKIDSYGRAKTSCVTTQLHLSRAVVAEETNLTQQDYKHE